MKKLTTISLFIFWAIVTASLIAGLVFYQNNKPDASTSGQDTGSNNSGNSNPPVQLTLDTKEISQHNLRTDCWLIINNKVYNVTGYLSIHPGGTGTITPYCGKEATQAFNTKDIGKPHSTSANNLLTDYYIGNLNQVINPTQANNVNNNPAPNSNTTPAQPNQTSQPPANTASSNVNLSLSEIAKHNTAADCWLIINNKVYNVTGYLSIHPGGTGTITPYCGKEATQAFNTKDIGKPHSTSANNLLTDYYIGNLNQVINPTQANNVNNNPAPNPQNAVPAQPSQTSQPPANTAISNVNLSLSEIAKHNTTADCWLIINNKVYGVASYLRSHPGGVGAISPYCGQDATQAFTGLPHSAFANNLLSSYLLGSLGQQISGQQVQNVNAQPQNIQSSGGETEYEDD